MQRGKEWFSAMYRRGVRLMAIGCVTGLFVGIWVTCYTLASKFVEEFTGNVYAMLRAHPAFVPVLFVALVAAAFAIGVILRLLPMLRGSGVPQIEGAARGELHFGWWKVLVGKAAVSLACMLMGIGAGAEGPSLQMGGAIGLGVGTFLRRTSVERRYQITGGASAGLAVAFNAPLTGLLFAFEEAHRRFTADIFICAFSSILIAVLTRNAMYLLFGMRAEVFAPVFSTYSFSTLQLDGYGYVLLIVCGCSIAGVAFYALAIACKKLFARMTFLKGVGKFLVPFLLAGAFGLVSVYATGGGHALIEALGTHGGTEARSLGSVFLCPAVVTLLIIVAMRFVATACNIGTGIPCGIFIPMLAIGAGLGAAMSELCIAWGMSEAYADLAVMIGMATFFTAVVRTPLTALVMVIELTGSFTPLLPVLLGISIGYMASTVCGLKPLYERLLEDELPQHVPYERHTVRIAVAKGSDADGVAVRDVLWPNTVLIRTIIRGGVDLVPTSDTVLHAGDVLVAQGEYETKEDLLADVTEIAGVRARRRASPPPESDSAAGEPPEEPTSAHDATHDGSKGGDGRHDGA